jgi:malonyl-CoA decarboxylase
MSRTNPMPRSLGGAPEFFNGLIETLTERGRALLRRNGSPQESPRLELAAMGEMLLSRRGEASGVALAQSLLSGFQAASVAERVAFLKSLVDRFGPDRRRVELAIEALRADDGRQALDNLHGAAEPRRQELIRRLNLAPGGTAALVQMREQLLGYLRDNQDLQAIDADFVHLFTSWFNRGFLVLRPIDWTTPANILEKIIRYEAVHAIRDWNDLRNRLEPDDRRCYGFFHPQLVDEPLIFVEVALTREIPASIGPLLDLQRKPIAATEATTAVFYSISNTQKGLGGVSFGNFLIKQVVQDLARELPGLKTFVTLSPVPGFGAWLARERKAEQSRALDHAAKEQLRLLDTPDWQKPGAPLDALREVLLAAAAFYFLKAKTPAGRPVDPVARFHLGNGARLERLNFLGDMSPNGVKQSHGLMVNYLYSIGEIEKNHEVFAESGQVVASAEVRRTLRADLASSDLVPAR